MNYTHVIEQLSATPAAGKTREARRLIELHVNNPKCKGIIVYAAPTRVLLEEVLSALKASTNAPDDIEDLIAYPRGKHITTQYAYALGMITKDEARPLLSRDEMTALEGAYKVLLCTHECITRAPKVVTKKSSEAFLIFDEARQCVLEDLEVRVTSDELEKIRSNFKLVKQVSGDDEVIIAGESHKSTLYSLNGTGFPTPQRLMSSFHADELADLPPVAKQLYKMKKTCEGGRADVLVEVLEPKDSKKQTAHIVGVARPSSIFEGYGRVLIMSAYFEHSQMYHLLKNAHLGHQKGKKMLTLVEYKASSKFRKASDQITENSLKNIRIGALLAGTKTKTLTASMLSSGLVIPVELHDLMRSKIAEGKKLPKKHDIQYAALMKERIVSLGKEGNALLHESGNPPLLELRKIAYEVLKKNKVRRALCFVNAFNGGSTGSKFVVGGRKGGTKLAVADLLHNIPGSLNNDAYRKERSFLSASMLEHLEKSATDTAPEAQTVNEGFFKTPPSTSVLGLNSYAGYHAFVHLAALNPKPCVARVLKRIMPGYEPDVDYAISNIIQTMYRTSLRILDSTEKVYCLVLSEWIIEKVERICFGGRKLKRLSYEPRHVVLGQTIDLEARSKGGKIGGKNKRKYSTGMEALSKKLMPKRTYYRKQAEAGTITEAGRRKLKEIEEALEKCKKPGT